MHARMYVEGLLVQMAKTMSLGHVGWDGMGWDGMGWDWLGWDGRGSDGNGMQMRIGTDGDGLSTGHMGWVGSNINSVLGTSCASHGVKAARGSPGCLALRGGESST